MSVVRKMEFEELKEFEGEVMEIKSLDKKFKLSIEHDLGGDWAVWIEDVEGEKDYIYATLNYESRCVPVAYHTSDCDMFGEEYYEGEVDDFEDYKGKVAELVEKIFQHRLDEDDKKADGVE